MDRITELSGKIEELVESYFHEPELRRLAKEFIAYKATESGVFGKLASLHCEMFGGSARQAEYAAAAAETMILALDIYDDLQDLDNDAVPWSQVPAALSLNVAIALQALSIEAVCRGAEGDDGRAMLAMRLLNHGILKAVNGQHTDLRNEWATEEECLQMIADKSGALVAAVCLAGTALATGKYNESVAAYGQALGVAAQLRNDIAGVERWDKRNDLLYRKRTLPLFYVLEEPGEKADMLRAYYDGALSRDDVLLHKQELMEFVQECGCIEYAQVHARIKEYEIEKVLAQMELEEHWKEQIRQYM
ncbi:polyprenyl synthetase family protein [Paenibacillus sp. GCM10012307]|uniref:Polyprenyl synthetase family protein n=1 Tax=Paenibacillus roseus TaxID=2798579 RepID=A0A934J6C0_9BACL|nr:polyprenyl synthetase family protein [Paenibacillus roseus]MBJ6361123.1 polyprenyl synthetase family protein [Paenibacillus roseus]